MAEAEQTITNPDEAIRRVLQGAKAEDVLARCEINEVFERREWAQAATTLATVLFTVKIEHRFEATSLAIGMLSMCRPSNVTAVG
jgi:hypothetical protein